MVGRTTCLSPWVLGLALVFVHLSFALVFEVRCGLPAVCIPPLCLEGGCGRKKLKANGFSLSLSLTLSPSLSLSLSCCLCVARLLITGS